MIDYKKEILEFVEAINSDFYLDLHKYYNYADIPFKTVECSFTRLVKIAEAYCTRPNVNTIRNTLPIDLLTKTIMGRLSLCKDLKLVYDTKPILTGMAFYSYQEPIKSDDAGQTIYPDFLSTSVIQNPRKIRESNYI